MVFIFFYNIRSGYVYSSAKKIPRAAPAGFGMTHWVVSVRNENKRPASNNSANPECTGLIADKSK